MRIIFFGTPNEVVPVLENLHKHFEVVAVVTAPDRKAGRKQLLTPPPVKIAANKHGIPVLQPTNFSLLTSHLSLLTADLYIVAAYGKIIPQAVLDLPKYGAINIHPSLLPKYRGPTPIQSALLNGDETSGISIMKMDAQMDHGPILQQILFKLESTDTFGWLMQSKFAQAAQVLPHIIEEYVSGRLEPKPQNDDEATYTKMITKDDGYIDLANPPTPEQLDRMIRAYYPWPTVWCKWQMENGKGKIIKFLPNHMLQMEGKQAVSFKDFINGYPELGEKLKNILW